MRTARERERVNIDRPVDVKLKLWTSIADCDAVLTHRGVQVSVVVKNL